MSNRFATIALIVIVSIISAGVFFIVGLFLFPGITLFGLRYIGPGTHDIGKRIHFNQLANYKENSNIVLNTGEVPVEIVFSNSDTSYSVVYYDDFNGITNSKDVEEPSITAEVDKDGQVVITTHEYRKFLYESSTSKRYLKLFIPISKVDSTLGFAKWSLTINTDESDIYFCKTDNTDLRKPTFHDLTINTNGKIYHGVKSGRLLDERTEAFSTSVIADNLYYTTNNSIIIDSAKTNIADATNYYLNSKRGNIDIGCVINGNLDLETNQGYIKLVSCNNLKVKTVYGTVGFGGETENGSVLVKGNAEIDSRAGSVTLGTVRGTSNIKTSSGNVKIVHELGGSSKIETTRGSVEIKKASNLDIDTNIGRVIVEEISQKADIDTMRGNIHLGTDETVVNNIDVFSRIGKVYAKSVNGNVKIEHLFDYQNDFKSSPRLLAKLTLAPGVSIGMHEHFGEEEVFHIISGTAEFIDGDTTYILNKGDSSLTSNASHSLANAGDDDLEVIAVILKF